MTVAAGRARGALIALVVAAASCGPGAGTPAGRSPDVTVPAARPGAATAASAGQFSGQSAEVQSCLRRALGDAFAAVAVRRRPPDAREGAAMAPCFGQPGGQSGPSGAAPLASGTACPDLQQLLARIEFDVPPWETVRCNVAGLTRSPPAFMKQVVSDPDGVFPIGQGRHVRYLELWDRLAATYAVNVSPMVAGGALPPYTDADRRPLVWPLKEADHDRLVRANVLFLTSEKRKGRPVYWSNHHPPTTRWPQFGSAAEFETWVRGVHLPQVKREAVGAELVKAEYFDAFPTELDHFFYPTLQPTLSQLPDAELIPLAQRWADAVRDVARQEFKGRLVCRLGAQVVGQHVRPGWQKLSCAGYDEMAMTVFTKCDVAQTRAYLRDQLAFFVSMAVRDRIPWSVGELDVLPVYVKACGNDFDTLEPALHREIFAQLSAQQPPPVGVSITIPALRLSAGRVGTDALNEALNSYLRAH